MAPSAQPAEQELWGSADSPDKLLRDLEHSNTLPLWVQMTRLNPPAPDPTAIPFVWEYEKIRPDLIRSGTLITEKQAERRVLMLVNPARGMLDFLYPEHFFFFFFFFFWQLEKTKHNLPQ